jgi:hypothetical protein
MGQTPSPAPKKSRGKWALPGEMQLINIFKMRNTARRRRGGYEKSVIQLLPLYCNAGVRELTQLLNSRFALQSHLNIGRCHSMEDKIIEHERPLGTLGEYIPGFKRLM